MDVRSIVSALSLVCVAAVGAMFYFVRPPAYPESSSDAGVKARADATMPASAGPAGQTSASRSVLESLEKRRGERQRMSRNTERMIQDLETDAELRRRGSNQGGTWAPSSGGWGR